MNRVIEAQPEFQQAYVVKANCLNESAQKEQALLFSKKGFNHFPNNHALGRLYASLLIESGDIIEAEKVFSELLEYYPESPSLILSHALVMVENGKIEQAKARFDKLLQLKSHRSDAHYYLARIAEQQQDHAEAIAQYKQVLDGAHLQEAAERAVFLMSQNEQLDEALEWLDILRSDQPNNAEKLWLLEYRLLNTLEKKEDGLKSLNKALIDFPQSENLLYARAMHYDALGELPAMEADLRKIIAINPENAIALNALGYTLADKTDRYQEALALIAAALKLKPNNPAIMDSMGWILFKLGEYEKALEILAVAFQNYPDGEVGAHLGEVLWVINQKQEAVNVWSLSLGKQPDHPILLETINRIAPELLQKAIEAKASEAAETAPVTDQ